MCRNLASVTVPDAVQERQLAAECHELSQKVARIQQDQQYDSTTGAMVPELQQLQEANSQLYSQLQVSGVDCMTGLPHDELS